MNASRKNKPKQKSFLVIDGRSRRKRFGAEQQAGAAVGQKQIFGIVASDKIKRAARVEAFGFDDINAAAAFEAPDKLRFEALLLAVFEKIYRQQQQADDKQQRQKGMKKMRPFHNANSPECLCADYSRILAEASTKGLPLLILFVRLQV